MKDEYVSLFAGQMPVLSTNEFKWMIWNGFHVSLVVFSSSSLQLFKNSVCLPGEWRLFGISVDCDRFTGRPRPGDLRSLRVLLYLRRLLFGDGDRLDPELEPDCDELPLW